MSRRFSFLGGSSESQAESASNTIERARATVEENAIESGIAESTLSEAVERFNAEDHERARKLAERATKAAEREAEIQSSIEHSYNRLDEEIPGEQSEALNSLADAREKLREGDFDAATETIESAMETARKTVAYRRWRGRSESVEAHRLVDDGDFQTAIDRWEAALDEYRDALERAKETDSRAVAGLEATIRTVEQWIAEARRNYDRTEIESLDDQAREAIETADRYVAAEQYEKAIPYLETARDRYERVEQLQSNLAGEDAIDTEERIESVEYRLTICRLADDDPETRRDAIEEITGRVASDPDSISDAVPPLLEGLREESTREAALRAVEAIAARRPDLMTNHVPEVAVVLDDADATVRRIACEVLGHIGTDVARSRLEELRDEADDYEVRVAAESALERVESGGNTTNGTPDTAEPFEAGSITPEADVESQLKAHLPDHEVLEWIGSGGNASVHKVRLEDRDSIAALKVPRWEGTLARETVEQFTQEAETWARLDNHDHIVDVVEWGTSPYPWMLLEYVETSLVDCADTLTVAERIEVLIDIADALEYAHGRGIVHLDIKPENILIDGTSAAKVADWGLARILLEHTQTQMGLSPPYSAPEQLTEDRGQIDRQTDVYQLGVVAYELLTGERPFDSDRPVDLQRQILETDPRPPSEVTEEVPSSVDDPVLTALSKRKDERYRVAEVMRNELSSAYSNL